jgi:hypothetical protein
MFAFHRLIAIKGQDSWAGIDIGQGGAYGYSLSPMLVCGYRGMIILHSKVRWSASGERMGSTRQNRLESVT